MGKIEEISERLQNLSDDNYKTFNAKLCPDTKKEMLGIRIPQLRKLAKEIIKTDIWQEFLEKSQDKYFEEVLLQGLVIAYSKIPLEEKFEYMEKFIPKMDSWAITDTFVPTFKVKEKDLEKFWNFILPYTKSKREFETRFAIIAMLDYYINESYVDKVINILDSIKHDGYYVKMAIAWTLAEIGIKFNDKAMKYLKTDNHLDKFTFNKTLQKMIESYRITPEQKQELRKMKLTNK